MTRYNEAYNINSDPDNVWETIASYMDDEIRERVHFELAPCTNEEFLSRYLELDPDFEDLLSNEFSICL